MFAIERREAILKIINEQGNVSISELVNIFNVSGETIRKDILALEADGLVIRTHGGAVSPLKKWNSESLVKRKQKFTNEKKELSKAAADYICEGDVIAVDEGSTAIHFSEITAARFNNLTVITHSLDVFNIFSKNERINLILCAGEFIRSENAFAGFMTVEAIKNIHVMKAFIFPSAISLKFGVSDSIDQKFLEVQRAYIDNADEIFILADSFKFETSGFLKICDIEKKYTYITDSKLDDKIYLLYKKNNINIVKGKKL